MIYIDASRYNNTDRRTGVENYSYFLINELVRLTPDQITLISPRKVDLPVPQITIPMKRLWTQIRLSWEVLKNKKIDNLFVPSHVMPIIHPRNTTITIHDVVFKRFPKSYGKLSRWYLNWGTKFAVKNAKRIIVPSHTTKKDLVKFYKANPNKITVIPLGIAPQIIKTDEQEVKNKMRKYHIKPQKYFLFIGRIETKKNVKTLINAFSAISEKYPDIKLVLVGKAGVGSQKILKAAQNSQNIIVTKYVKEMTKQILLENCLCFVFPSIYEGFGLPLLEAMQADVPIIASKIPTSYDIAKQNALFFETRSSKDLVHQMEVMIRHSDLREKLMAHHHETLKQYSWKKCAKETLKTLRG